MPASVLARSAKPARLTRSTRFTRFTRSTRFARSTRAALLGYFLSANHYQLVIARQRLLAKALPRLVRSEYAALYQVLYARSHQRRVALIVIVKVEPYTHALTLDVRQKFALHLALYLPQQWC